MTLNRTFISNSGSVVVSSGIVPIGWSFEQTGTVHVQEPKCRHCNLAALLLISDKKYYKVWFIVTVWDVMWASINLYGCIDYK